MLSPGEVLPCEEFFAQARRQDFSGVPLAEEHGRFPSLLEAGRPPSLLDPGEPPSCEGGHVFPLILSLRRRVSSG